MTKIRRNLLHLYHKGVSVLHKIASLIASMFSMAGLEKKWGKCVLLFKIGFIVFIILITCIETIRVFSTIKKSVIVMPFTTISPDKQIEKLGESFSETLTIELDNITQTFQKNAYDIGLFFDVGNTDEQIPPVISSRNALEMISLVKFSPSLPVSIGKESFTISTIFHYVISFFTSEYGKAQIYGTIEKYDKEIRFVVKEIPADGNLPTIIRRPIKNLDVIYDIAQELTFGLLRSKSNSELHIRSYKIFYELLDGYKDFNQYVMSGNDAYLASAEKHFFRTVGKGDNDAYGYYNLGVIANEKAVTARQGAERKKRRQEAMNYFAKAIQADPDFTLAHAALLKLYSIEYFRYGNATYLDTVKRYLERNEGFFKLIEREKNENAKAILYHALGVNYYIAKNWNAAIFQYRQAVKIKPDFGRAYLDLGDVYLKKGELASAEKEYIAAGKNGEKGTSKALCALYYYTSQFDKTIEFCTRAKQADYSDEKESYEASLLLGYAYIYRGINRKSREDVESGIKEAAQAVDLMKSTSDKNQIDRGYLYQAYGHAALGNKDQALSLLRQVQLLSDSRHPDHWFYLANCAEVYSALGMLGEACSYTKQAFQRDWNLSMGSWFNKQELSPLLNNVRPYVLTDVNKKKIDCKAIH